MKTNETLQKDVQDAIMWEPLLNAAEIGVTVKDGIVSLTGTVDSYSKKLEAEDAAKNVAGVKAVIENIEVKFSNNGNSSDYQITQAVLSALKGSSLVPNEKLKVKVEDGWVTLTGTVPWYYQKTAALDAVRYLSGVTGVTNDIKIKSDFDGAIEQEDVEGALARSWWVNDTDITVTVSDHEVTLTGSVPSYFQKQDAERIAWNTPGIWSIDNELVVDWD